MKVQLWKGQGNADQDLGLLSGQAGISLYLYYCSRHFNDGAYADRASLILERVLGQDNIFELQKRSTLCSGLGGVAWTISHLQSLGFLDPHEKLIDPSIDDYLSGRMIGFIRAGNFDFLHGAIGIALYLLDRIKENNRNKVALEILVDELERNTILFDDCNGLAWNSIIDYESGKRGFNLSLSHGLSSIIIILTKLHRSNIRPDKTRILLDKAINFLLNSKFQSTEDSLYPSYFIPGEKQISSRVSWCYGDLGIAFALWHAGIELEKVHLQNHALEIFRACAVRRTFEKSFVADAGICHGAFGVAHMFNRVYKMTSEGMFNEVATFWYKTGLSMAHFSDGYAGFKGKFRNEWSPRENFLEGVAGIGLCLLATVDNHDPCWDQCLLLS